MTLEGLRTERLHLRRWREEDRPVFHRLNSDEAVMAFFPFRRTQAESEAAMDLWNESLDRTGLQFLAAERQADGVVVGMSASAASRVRATRSRRRCRSAGVCCRRLTASVLLPKAHAPAFATRSSASTFPSWCPTVWSRTAPRRR
ncbi:hypothetical protein GGR04_002330 [Aureimonas pseudogalii]|uniref:N-acetyltransferase domain-containing protein n=1 Tax=Aureimonas pseudogalii TaxID=1744844 RepID=A0A7W6EHS7_9HYPH|nr:hypothetical protein [Aureimonas pseudogalii]